MVANVLVRAVLFVTSSVLHLLMFLNCQLNSKSTVPLLFAGGGGGEAARNLLTFLAKHPVLDSKQRNHGLKSH